MSRRSAKNEVLKVGAEPRADLMPPEVHARAAGRRMRSRANLGVLLIVAIMVAASALAAFSAIQSQVMLTLAQDRTMNLIGQQAQYAEMKSLREQINLMHAAQKVGASTEIDWQDYIAKVYGTVPEGSAITAVTVQAASPIEPLEQSATPFAAGSRVASVTLQATVPDLGLVRAWLDTLATLPGYVDANVGSVTAVETGGFDVALVMHVNEKAFTNRFGDKPADDKKADDASDETTSAEGGK